MLPVSVNVPDAGSYSSALLVSVWLFQPPATRTCPFAKTAPPGARRRIGGRRPSRFRTDDDAASAPPVLLLELHAEVAKENTKQSEAVTGQDSCSTIRARYFTTQRLGNEGCSYDKSSAPPARSSPLPFIRSTFCQPNDFRKTRLRIPEGRRRSFPCRIATLLFFRPKARCKPAGLRVALSACPKGLDMARPP
jgi:hypothetical protein